MELDFLKRARVPTRVFMNLGNFNLLVKELEQDRYFHSIHNMQIEIVSSKSAQLIVL
jgi:hypothetical protein